MTVAALRTRRGRDPDDLRAPAIASNSNRRLLLEGIEAIWRGGYDSTDDLLDAARDRKPSQGAVDSYPSR